MIVGIMQVELMIYDAMTLKDKRRVVKSIKDRVAHEFNVSIAEVDALDVHRKAFWESAWWETMENSFGNVWIRFLT